MKKSLIAASCLGLLLSGTLVFGQKKGDAAKAMQPKAKPCSSSALSAITPTARRKK